MDSATRLTKLLEFLENDPNDPFLIYGVAMEYLSSDSEKAMHYFNQLLSEHPEYLATYYHAGKLYEENGSFEKAVELYKKGIDLAAKQADQKTLMELREAINQLEGEY